MSKNTETVKVMIRTRPMNQKEFDRGTFKFSILGSTRIVKCDGGTGQVHLFKPNESTNPRTFTFDRVYGEDSTQ